MNDTPMVIEVRYKDTGELVDTIEVNEPTEILMHPSFGARWCSYIGTDIMQMIVSARAST